MEIVEIFGRTVKNVKTYRGWVEITQKKEGKRVKLWDKVGNRKEEKIENGVVLLNIFVNHQPCEHVIWCRVEKKKKENERRKRRKYCNTCQ